MSGRYTAYSDGGARGNPGPAGIGAVVYTPSGECHAIKKFIGHATNNQAEYRALIAALEHLVAHGAQAASCFLDSELLVKQMRREYRVKDPELGKLFMKAWGLAGQVPDITFTHIPREKNKEADKLVNEALDEAKSY